MHLSYLALLVASLADVTTARIIFQAPEQAVLEASAKAEKYLVELSPGKTKWVTEDDKWALKRVR